MRKPEGLGLDGILDESGNHCGMTEQADAFGDNERVPFPDVAQEFLRAFAYRATVYTGITSATWESEAATMASPYSAAQIKVARFSR